jgi:hypothetical protein
MFADAGATEGRTSTMCERDPYLTDSANLKASVNYFNQLYILWASFIIGRWTIRQPTLKTSTLFLPEKEIKGWASEADQLIYAQENTQDCKPKKIGMTFKSPYLTYLLGKEECTDEGLINTLEQEGILFMNCDLYVLMLLFKMKVYSAAEIQLILQKCDTVGNRQPINEALGYGLHPTNKWPKGATCCTVLYIDETRVEPVSHIAISSKESKTLTEEQWKKCFSEDALYTLWDPRTPFENLWDPQAPFENVTLRPYLKVYEIGRQTTPSSCDEILATSSGTCLPHFVRVDKLRHNKDATLEKIRSLNLPADPVQAPNCIVSRC